MPQSSAQLLTFEASSSLGSGVDGRARASPPGPEKCTFSEPKVKLPVVVVVVVVVVVSSSSRSRIRSRGRWAGFKVPGLSGSYCAISVQHASYHEFHFLCY